MNTFCTEKCCYSRTKVQPLPDLKPTNIVTKAVLRKFQFKVLCKVIIFLLQSD